MDDKDLLDAINQVMPYGKYKGRQLLDLPEPYLVWYHSNGFPQGKLGAQLALIYEVKLNGLEGRESTGESTGSGLTFHSAPSALYEM